MGEIETTGPQARGLPPARPLQRRVEADRRRRAVQRAVPRGRRRARRPLHLPPRARPLPDGHQRVQPRQGPRLVRSSTPATSTSRSATPTSATRCSPSRARWRARSCRRSATPRCPSASPPPPARCSAAPSSSAAPATPARTASSCCCDPGDAVALWDEVVRRGATPAGLAARDTLRLEVCYHLYGNDLDGVPRPDRGRPRLGLQGGHGLHRLRGRRAPRGPPARPRSSSPSGSRARGSPGRATRSSAAARSPAAPCRRASTSGSAWPTCPPPQAEPGTELQIDVRGKQRTAVVAKKPLYAKETNG